MNNTTMDVAEEKDIPIAYKKAVNVCIVIFALFGNLLLVMSLMKSKKLRNSTTNMLILNLAFCDIFVVMFSVTSDMVQYEYDNFPFGEIGCRMVYPTSTFLMITVVFTLIMLAMERYIAIVYPFKYRLIKRLTLHAICVSHFLSFICVVPYAYHLSLSPDMYCEETWSTWSSGTYTIFLFLIQYAIPLPIIIIMYAYSWFRIKQQNDEIIRVSEQQRHRVGPIDEETIAHARFDLIQTFVECKHKNKLAHQFSKLKRTSRKSKVQYNTQLALLRHKQTKSMLQSFIMVVTVFAICMLPNQITWICLTIGETTVSNAWLSIAYWLTYVNSVFNPIIYGINPKFRRAYLREIKRFRSFCCKVQSESNVNASSVYTQDGEYSVNNDSEYTRFKRQSPVFRRRNQTYDPLTQRKRKAWNNIISDENSKRKTDDTKTQFFYGDMNISTDKSTNDNDEMVNPLQSKDSSICSEVQSNSTIPVIEGLMSETNEEQNTKSQPNITIQDLSKATDIERIEEIHVEELSIASGKLSVNCFLDGKRVSLVFNKRDLDVLKFLTETDC